MLDLFVTSGDPSAADVRGLLEDLGALGDNVWCEAQQGSGPAWWEQTLARIRSSDALVFALTPRTLESEACWREMRYAHALGKSVLAVELCERTDLGAIPAPLATLPFVDYRKRDRDAALRLCKALRPLAKAAALPDVLPAPPGLPPTHLASLRELIDSRGKLDAEQQTRLISELGRESRELHSAFEARQLLLALRQRRDLSASASAEVDALLRKSAATQIRMRPPPGSLQPPPARASAPLASSTRPTSAQQGARAASPVLSPKRLGAALGGLVSCTAAGCLIANAAQRGDDYVGLPADAAELPGLELVALLVLGAGLVGATARIPLSRVLLVSIACVVLAGAWLAFFGYADSAFPSSLVAAPAGLMLGTGLAAAWQGSAQRRLPAPPRRG